MHYLKDRHWEADMFKLGSYDTKVSLDYKRKNDSEREVVITVKTAEGQRDVTAITFPKNIESLLEQETPKK